MIIDTWRKRLTRFQEWRARRAEVSRCASGGPYCYKCRARRERQASFQRSVGR